MEITDDWMRWPNFIEWLHFISVLITWRIAQATMRAAHAAHKTADVAARQFRLSRRPRIRLTWGEVWFSRDNGTAAISVRGRIQELAGLSTTISTICHQGDFTASPDTFSGTANGGVVRGDALEHAFSLQFLIPDSAATDGILAFIRVFVTVFTDDPSDSETWEYRFAVGQTDATDFEVLDGLSEPRLVGPVRGQPAAPNHLSSRLTEALQRAWTGGISRFTGR